MKRLTRSKSGKLIYGPKWMNINQIPSSSSSVASAHQLSHAPSTSQNNQIQTPKESGGRYGESMYKAALEGDWVAAELILSSHPNLAVERITPEGDRALHVAAAMKHQQFVQKLVERMSPTDLALLDGKGYTACCYAAISGIVEIVDVLVKRNTNLVTVRDTDNVTPLEKAAFCGNDNVVSYFLKLIRVEDLSRDEWFHLFLLLVRNKINSYRAILEKAAYCGNNNVVSYFLKLIRVEDLSNDEWFELFLLLVRNKMYDVGLELLEKNGSVAALRNEEGTALHALAREEISHVRTYTGFLECYRRRLLIRGFTRTNIQGVMKQDIRLLVEKLWDEIKKFERASALDLMKNPPILHDAAKVGNAELITMVTRSFPNLIWNADDNGYTIFHIAVIYRRENIFRLIYQAGAMKHMITTSQDQNGDTILHLAGKLAPHSRRKIVPIPALQMQGELAWFKEVEAVVPISCQKTRNKEGKTPRELFSIEHKSLLEKSEAWMRNTADSCMLIATLMLTVVFTAAFTVPGGNNQETGIPILLKRIWFTSFIIFEALALFGSTLSIVTFWSIMTSSFDEDQFLNVLPYQLKLGLGGLLLSLVGTISVFMAAYFLVFVAVRAWLIKFVIIWTYVVLIVAIGMEFAKLLSNTSLERYFSEILPRSVKDRLLGRYRIIRD